MTPDQLADILRAFGYGAYVPLFFSLVGFAAKLAAASGPSVGKQMVWPVMARCETPWNSLTLIMVP